MIACERMWIFSGNGYHGSAVSGSLVEEVFVWPLGVITATIMISKQWDEFDFKMRIREFGYWMYWLFGPTEDSFFMRSDTYIAISYH